MSKLTGEALKAGGDALKAWYKAFVGWFPDKYKVVLAMGLVAGLLLFLPWHIVSTMHIEKFADSYRAWEWLVFLFCSFLLVATGAEKVWITLRAHTDLDKRLKQMPPSESAIVVSLLAGEQILKHSHEEGVESLHQDGILWREASQFNFQFVYGLTRAARERAIALGLSHEGQPMK